jgi:hypothetical protein
MLFIHHIVLIGTNNPRGIASRATQMQRMTGYEKSRNTHHADDRRE